MKNRHFVIFTFLALAFLLIGRPANAEDEQPGAGRISVINGEVSTKRGDSGDWVATTVNTPIAPGDEVSTGARSRTEIQLDYANILRLDQSTVAKVADLTRNRIQVQVAQGLVNFDVLKGSEAQAEIDTPNVAVHPLGEGRYRIEVGSDSQTRITVREGEAEVSTPQGSTQVKKGELITIEGTDNPQYQIASAAGNDDWDNWNKDRDHAVENAESWQHTNRYYAGSGDLDRYGHWEYVPGYDYVWAPYAGPGWVPYSAGSWVWEPYWGWTWVSYEPWGWAPYHYGRWFCYGNSWVWWPGPVYAAYRPLWAPAYVSFFGFGFGAGHFGFGFGFGLGAGFGFGGSIGWLPIGPHDPFFPWYGRYRGSYNVVNVTNVTNIRNINNIGRIGPLGTARQPMMSNLNSVLNNSRVRQGLTTVPAAQFGRGQIGAGRQSVTPEMIRQGQLVAGAVPVVPTHAGLSAVNRPANQAALPAHSNANQHFFTKNTPPAGPRPFTEQAEQVRQMIQQKAAPANAERGAGATGAPAANARGQGEGQRNGTASAEARTGSTLTGTNGAANRSSTFGNEPAGSTRSSSRTPSYDNEALNRLPETGFGRSGNQPAGADGGSQAGGRPASQKPQGSPSAQSGTVAGHGATPQSSSGWHRFSERSSASGDRTQASPSAPHSAGQGQAGWQKFERPAPSERNSPNSGSRSESTNPGWNRSPSRSESPSYGQSPRTYQGPRSESSNPGWNRFPQRSESPSYGQSQRSYQRPPLEISKPIVTERASHSYGGGSRGGNNGGYRGSAPSGARGSSSSGSHSRGSSSSGSHSGGHGRR